MQTTSDTPPRTLFALAPTPPYPESGHTPCASNVSSRSADPALVTSSVWFGPFVPEHFERDFMAFLGAHNGVAVLTWPRDREHAEHLAQAGLPRLLLVPSPEVPPRTAPLQDWLPTGASYAEIQRCLLKLSRAAAVQRSTAGPPTLDDQGQLRVGDAFSAIPEPERALTEILVTYFGAPVAVTALTGASNAASPTALHALLWQLDRRANTLGLEIVPTLGDAYALRRCADRATACTSPTPPQVVNPASPPRKLRPRPTLPMHFRSGLLAPNLP
jgi:hypothetical protein